MRPQLVLNRNPRPKPHNVFNNIVVKLNDLGYLWGKGLDMTCLLIMLDKVL